MAGSRATVTKELVVLVPAHHLYGLLANYSRYQEIWPGEYQSVHVLDQSKKAGRKDTTTVEFTHTPVRGAHARGVRSTGHRRSHLSPSRALARRAACRSWASA